MDDLRKFQAAAIHILSHPKMMETLNELDTNRESRAAAKKDIRGYLKGRGIEISKEMTLEFTENKFSLKVCWGKWCISISHG